MAGAARDRGEGAAGAFRARVRWSDGGARAASAARPSPLRPACLAVEGQPRGNFQRYQSGGNLRGQARLRAAGGAAQRGPARTSIGLTLPDSPADAPNGIAPAGVA